MELDAVVGCGLELVGVEVLDYALLPAGPNRLLPSLTASEHLNVHHMVLLLPTLGVEVDSAVEDQISGLQLLKGEVDRKRVVLVGLVPAIQLESEVFPQVVDHLTNQGAAVEEERCIVEGVSRVVIPLRVGDPKVLYAPIDELLAQLPFEGRVAPILLRLLSHIVPVLNLFLFGLPKPRKVSLQTPRLHATAEAQKLSFGLASCLFLRILVCLVLLWGLITRHDDIFC